MRLIDADALWMEVIHTLDYCDDILEIIEHQKTIWTTHPNDSNTLESLDCIGRQEAVEAMFALVDGCERDDPYRENPHIDAIVDALESLTPAQPMRWIPCSERLPDDLEEVNVTWVNHDPEPYYNFVKDKPFTATAVYYKEKWYWYSSTCADLLAEYGRNPNQEIDDGIEITAWMPLPEPYKGEKE